jgi:hypothetical protein
MFIRFGAVTTAVVVGLVILVTGFRSQSSADSSIGAAVVRSLPGCMPGTISMGPGKGGPEDNNAVFLGGCELNDGTQVRVTAWQAGDTIDQHAYAAGWAPGGTVLGAEGAPVFCCVMSPAGSQPWAIALQAGTDQAPGKDWAAVVRATHGIEVTRIPAGWSEIG